MEIIFVVKKMLTTMGQKARKFSADMANTIGLHNRVVVAPRRRSSSLVDGVAPSSLCWECGDVTARGWWQSREYCGDEHWVFKFVQQPEV